MRKGDVRATSGERRRRPTEPSKNEKRARRENFDRIGGGDWRRRCFVAACALAARNRVTPAPQTTAVDELGATQAVRSARKQAEQRSQRVAEATLELADVRVERVDEERRRGRREKLKSLRTRRLNVAAEREKSFAQRRAKIGAQTDAFAHDFALERLERGVDVEAVERERFVRRR